MITRIEIDGFKSFHDFAVDLHPFQVFIGSNGAGKSNLFDALTLLSSLASGLTVFEAFSGIRGGVGAMFTLSPNEERAKKMTFAVEMLIEKTIDDGRGTEEKVAATRLRYELRIEQATENGLDALWVKHESLVAIEVDKDSWVKTHIPEEKFANWIVTPQYDEFIVTRMVETPQGEIRPFISMYHDDRTPRSRGSAVHAILSRTWLSAVDNVQSSPTIYAARQEMMAWHMLHLEPDKMRTDKMYDINQPLLPDGANLATVLFRLAQDRFVFTDTQRDLTNFIPGITGIVSQPRNGSESRVEIAVETLNGVRFNVGVLSDGTLRLLALVTLKNDPLHHGVLCVEEPENGVHPVRLKQIVGLLQAMTTDFNDDSEYADTTLRQVFINTHSPGLISYVPQEKLTLVYMANSQIGASTMALSVKPFGTDDSQRRFFTEDQVRRFLDPQSLEKSLEALGYNL